MVEILEKVEDLKQKVVSDPLNLGKEYQIIRRGRKNVRVRYEDGTEELVSVGGKDEEGPKERVRKKLSRPITSYVSTIFVTRDCKSSSMVYRCAKCDEPIGTASEVFFNGSNLKDEISCPHCGALINLEWNI